MSNTELKNNSIIWCGMDWGETIINPLGNYENWVALIKEIYTKLGKPDVIEEKVARFDKLIEQYDYDERLMDGVVEKEELWRRYFRIKHLRETGIQEFYSYVLDDDPAVVEPFRKAGFSFIKIADGLEECLSYMKAKGISINIVSDVTSENLVRAFPGMLKSFGLSHYFSEIITNHGRFKSNGEMDVSYKGMEKVDGTIYKKLVQDLVEIGIQPYQALIVGDRPLEDIEKAKENGFITAQYIGIIKRKISDAADYVISDLRELKDII